MIEKEIVFQYILSNINFGRIKNKNGLNFLNLADSFQILNFEFIIFLFLWLTMVELKIQKFIFRWRQLLFKYNNLDLH